MGVSPIDKRLFIFLSFVTVYEIHEVQIKRRAEAQVKERTAHSCETIAESQGGRGRLSRREAREIQSHGEKV